MWLVQEVDSARLANDLAAQARADAERATAHARTGVARAETEALGRVTKADAMTRRAMQRAAEVARAAEVG